MGKFLLLGAMALLLHTTSTAQQTEADTSNTDKVFSIVEQLPEYPGGMGPLYEYLSTITYPLVAQDSAWEGTAYLKFIVEKNGEISELQVVRSSGHPVLDHAALLHLAKMPNWIPGNQDGKAVRVYYSIPIRFMLN